MISYQGLVRTFLRDCWQTPLWLFDALDIEFGFWLDSAASDKNALCAHWLTEADDALNSEWVLDIMHRSELGKPLPDDFTFEFNPLWQMSDVDRSTVAVNTTNAISTALGDGLMTLKAAMTDLRENSDVTGIGASITDEDIENAEDEAPPGIGELGDKPPESPGGDPISNEPTADSAGGRGYRKWSLRWFK
ncbi:hypothetical protein CI686_02290 [Escherichia coli]|nr:hypothetical protein CI686_02290 [Escherichia coli]